MLNKVPIISFETDIFISEEVPVSLFFKGIGNTGAFSVDNKYNLGQKPIIKITVLSDITQIKLTNVTTGVSVDVINSLTLNDILTVEADATFKGEIEVDSAYTGMFTLKENCINEYSVEITPISSTVDIEFTYNKSNSNGGIQYFVDTFTISDINDLYEIPGNIISQKALGHSLVKTGYSFLINQLWYKDYFSLSKNKTYTIRYETKENSSRIEYITYCLCGCMFGEIGLEEKDGELCRKNITGVACDLFKI